MVKAELYNDNFQNYKRYNIPKAQLVIADIPYNIITLGQTHMRAPRSGTMAARTKTGKANWQNPHSLTAMGSSI